MLNITGYLDVLPWAKTEEGETLSKQGVFPVTRYEDVLNRPRALHLSKPLVSAPTASFHLVVTDVLEVDDDTIFEWYNQVW